LVIVLADVDSSVDEGNKERKAERLSGRRETATYLSSSYNGECAFSVLEAVLTGPGKNLAWMRSTASADGVPTIQGRSKQSW